MIFINQLREKIGIMFGNPETTPGGRALKFYSSVRLDVRASEKIKDGDKIVGTRVKVKVVKNKVAPPFREASFVLIHGEGILREADIIDQAVNFGIAQRSGAWYTAAGEKLGQGFEGTIKYLKDNGKVTNKLETEIRKAISAAVKN
jgi:recombination protein RecA